MVTKTPIGQVELESGLMNIYAMDDLFLNYTFENEENWEDFRLMINILLDEYRRQNPATVTTLIEGEIHIETQYKFYVNANMKNKTRNQDFKLNERDTNKLKYVEFQNRTNTKPPLIDRAIEYFSLSIGSNPGKTIMQIWLFASDTASVSQEETFINYILKDEVTNKVYPNTSSIMFISLIRLSKQNNIAGELAAYLLGKLPIPESEEVKQIASTFSSSFETFKTDKEVKNTMTIAEKWKNEAWMDGIEQGLEQGVTAGAVRLVELLKIGLSPEEALRKIKEERAELASSLMHSPV